MNFKINAMGQNSTMEGRAVFGKVTQHYKNTSLTEPAAKVATTIQANIEQTKQDVQQLQTISNTIGRKIRFTVNDRLGDVIIKIIDPDTDKVIKEIPSEEVQKLKIHMKDTFGFLVNEMR